MTYELKPEHCAVCGTKTKEVIRYKSYEEIAAVQEVIKLVWGLLLRIWEVEKAVVVIRELRGWM